MPRPRKWCWIWAALKTPPGEYVIVLYGGYTTKYRYNLAAVKAAEEAQKKVRRGACTWAVLARRLADEATAAPADKKAQADEAAKPRPSNSSWPTRRRLRRPGV